MEFKCLPRKPIKCSLIQCKCLCSNASIKFQRREQLEMKKKSMS